jgi:GAF domain-containing protein
MLKAFRQFFSSPPNDEEEINRVARILTSILWVSIFLLGLSRTLSYFEEKSLPKLFLNPISVLILALLGLIYLSKIGYVKVASFLLIAASWTAFLSQARLYTGIYDTAFIANTIIILLAGLLLDYRFSILFAVLAIFTGWGLAIFQTSSGIPATPDNPYNIARDYTIIFSLLMVISYLTISGLRNAIIRARQNATELSKSNTELLILQSELEGRVKQRTIELEERNNVSITQAKLLESVSIVSRSINAIQNIDTLLPIITSLISERFNFFHTGIFLLDETNAVAVLRAASSTGGKKMIEKSYKVDVQPDTLVGFVASRAKSRINNESESYSSFSSNPDLPETRSEIALPLIVGNKVLGVLDIHSDQENIFSAEYVNALETLANQVASSIQNTLLFGETRAALADAEKAYKQFVVGGWQKVAMESQNHGYRYTSSGVNPIITSVRNPVIGNEKISRDGSKNKIGITIPIKLRDQTIGVLNITSKDSGNDWDQDEYAIIQATAERAALALENARLLQDSQRRASKERVIGEITSRISAAIDMENILKTAVEELGSTIPETDIIIQFTDDQPINN